MQVPVNIEPKFLYMFLQNILPLFTNDTAFLKHCTFAYRCQKWVVNTRREDLLGKETLQLHRNYQLCANHFENNQFMNVVKKNSLVHNAVPTLFDVPNPPPKVTMKRKLPNRTETVEPKRKNTKGKLY